jgi:hypothetical protein
VCQWSTFATGAVSSAVALLLRLAKITSDSPSTSTTAMVTGNVRLRCWETLPPPPARLARATFFDDEALPIGMRR